MKMNKKVLIILFSIVIILGMLATIYFTFINKKRDKSMEIENKNENRRYENW